MNDFVDPRDQPTPATAPTFPRTTSDPDELEPLRELCREGRLYEVERWIRKGRPLQVDGDVDLGRRRWSSALEIALENGNHALVLLLLCNGYDPTLERHSPLNRALEDRRFDLVDLLLTWGADPSRVSLRRLFGTYKTELFERFRDLGVDLTEGHAMARVLAHHTSNTPLFGFAKRHRDEDPAIETELNVALGRHARKGNERGVALCLWAGADPHAPAPDLRYDDSSDDHVTGVSAVRTACRAGNVDILEELDPDPAIDDFDELYKAADGRAVIDFLAERAPPEDADAVIRHHLWDVTLDLGQSYGTWGSLLPLEHLFEVGVRWEESSKEAIGQTRRQLIKASDRTSVDVMKLLAKDDHCAPEILRELARTDAIRRRMKEVSFIPPDPDDSDRRRWRQNRPTRFREVLKKCGIEYKKPERPLPRTVRIGSRRSSGGKLRLDREELFERVWSDPISTLAEEWNISDRGLAKACDRLKIPTPPRGYWQKRRAGKEVDRPELPEVPDGQGEEIVVYRSG